MHQSKRLTCFLSRLCIDHSALSKGLQSTVIPVVHGNSQQEVLTSLTIHLHPPLLHLIYIGILLLVSQGKNLTFDLDNL